MRFLVKFAYSTLAVFAASTVLAQEPAGEPVDGTWPKEVKTSAGTFTVYQPQLDAFDGLRTSFYAALAVQSGGEEEPPVFGVADFEARTEIDKLDRKVTFSDIEVTRVSFPSAPEREGAWGQAVRDEVVEVTRIIALGRFEALLEVLDVDKNVRELPLKNEPPKIVFSTKPTILGLCGRRARLSTDPGHEARTGSLRLFPRGAMERSKAL